MGSVKAMLVNSGKPEGRFLAVKERKNELISGPYKVPFPALLTPKPEKMQNELHNLHNVWKFITNFSQWNYFLVSSTKQHTMQTHPQKTFTIFIDDAQKPLLFLVEKISID